MLASRSATTSVRTQCRYKEARRFRSLKEKNMFKYVALLALIGCAWAAPEGDKQPAQTGIDFPEVFTKAQKNIEELTASIQQHLNIPDQKTVVETVKNQSTTFVNNVQNYIATVSEEVKNKTPELEKLWTDVKSKLSKVVEDINSQVPNAKESADQLQKQFQEGVQTLVKESNSIAEQFKQNSGQVKEDIATFTKKAVDIAVEATQSLNEQLKNAASQATTEKKN